VTSLPGLRSQPERLVRPRGARTGFPPAGTGAASSQEGQTSRTPAASNALTLNITVPDGVQATARDGNLTLTGLVEFGGQREAAERSPRQDEDDFTQRLRSDDEDRIRTFYRVDIVPIGRVS